MSSERYSFYGKIYANCDNKHQYTPLKILHMLHYTLHDIHNISHTVVSSEQHVDLQTKLKISWSTFHPRFNMKIIIENFGFENFKISVLAPHHPPHKKKTPPKLHKILLFFLFLFCAANK
jgi:hypothetical protein